MALKSAQILDFFNKLSGFADFENTADRGVTENFRPDTGLVLSSVKFGSWILNKDRITDLLPALVGMLAFSLAILFSDESHTTFDLVTIELTRKQDRQTF